MFEIIESELDQKLREIHTERQMRIAERRLAETRLEVLDFREAALRAEVPVRRQAL